MEFLTKRLRFALPLAGLHLAGSFLVAALAAVLVFVVWFPYPYRDLVGGRELFLLIVGVDVVAGPLLTLVMCNPTKSRRELFLDLSLVALIQLCALGYGLHSVAQARPVYLAFEVDRMRAVTYADVQHEALKPDAGGLQVLGWDGPKVIGIRTPKDNAEMMRSLDLALGGVDQAFRPDWWVPYETVINRVLEKAIPLPTLRQKRVGEQAVIDKAITETGLSDDELVWLPVTSFQSTGWVAFLDKRNAKIVGFAPVDGF